jgi:hypothetical protein
MAVILGGGGVPFDKIGSFNPALMVHGTEGIELYGEIPPDGEIESVGEITGIWDKGKAAVAEIESMSTLVSTGKPLFKVKMSMFCRGAGDFGGERGPSPTFVLPTRKPDHELTYATREDQALTYRLSGDRNPLHSDPAFAKMGGFDRPILHGLCTYGFTGRALLHALCGSDPTRFKAMDGRFSPVCPATRSRSRSGSTARPASSGRPTRGRGGAGSGADDVRLILTSTRQIHARPFAPGRSQESARMWERPV